MSSTETNFSVNALNTKKITTFILKYKLTEKVGPEFLSIRCQLRGEKKDDVICHQQSLPVKT